MATPKIIPISKLHKCLADPRLDGAESGFKEGVGFNVSFYGNWYPEKTKEQFELAHRQLAQAGQQPPFTMMAYERFYAPDQTRFLISVRHLR